MMLSTIDALSAQIDQLTARIEQLITPLEHQVQQLDEISGVGRICAQDIIAEIGVDMTVFATAAHLVSWAKFCPQVHQSGGRQPRNRATGRGDPWLAGALGEAAAGAARTRTFLGERYRRLARRRGKEGARRRRQLDADHHLAPARRPGHALPRPRRRLLRDPHQPAPPRAIADQPARTDHRQEGHPAACATADFRVRVSLIDSMTWRSGLKKREPGRSGSRLRAGCSRLMPSSGRTASNAAPK